MRTGPPATFIPRFCASLNREILFVRTKDGTYSKYTFNTMTNQFLAANCSDCHVVPSETDLLPLYAAWSNRLERYVIFAKNSLNGKVEQYVYEKDYEGFQQVSQPELQFDEKRISTSNEFFVVGGTETEGVTAIRRDANGHFRKEQMNWGTKKFEKLPAVPVKILMEEEKKVVVETIPVTVEVPVEKIKEIASGLEQREQAKENQILQVNTVRITAPLRKRKSVCNVASGDNAKKEVGEKGEPKKKPVEVQLQRGGTKNKLSAREVNEIRHIAALMGNPVKTRGDDEESSDDADYTSDSDYDDVQSKGGSFDVVESSC